MRLTVRGGHLPHMTSARPVVTPAPAYWLMKSEPAECSIDDLAARAAPDRALDRRAQLPGAQLHARRDARRRRRAVLSLVVPAAGHRRPGRGRVAPPTPTQRSSTRRARTSTPSPRRDAPRWLHVDVKLVRKTRLLPLRRDARRSPNWRRCAAAARQPAVDHAGDGRRVARRAGAAARPRRRDEPASTGRAGARIAAARGRAPASWPACWASAAAC